MGTRVTVQIEHRCWESRDSIILSSSVFYFWGLSMTHVRVRVYYFRAEDWAVSRAMEMIAPFSKITYI